RGRRPCQAGIPALVVERPEPTHPGTVARGWKAVVWHTVHGHRRGVGVQAEILGRLAEDLAHAKWAHGWERVRLATVQERIAPAVAGHADLVLKLGIVRLHLVVAERPVAERMPFR